MRQADYYWFKLFNVRGLGNKSMHAVFEKLQGKNITLENIFELDQRDFWEIFGNKIRVSYESIINLDEEKIYHNYNELREKGIEIIGLNDPRYPQKVMDRLQENSPAILFCKGCVPLLNAQSVALVGSRNLEEPRIIQMAKDVSKGLSNNGYNVVSGYAKGVDTLAHVGALESGGTTTFVLSHGFNYLTIKREIHDLGWEQNGLFVSQFAPYEKFSGHSAMKRNKLICSMADKVVAISSGPERDEVGRMSGTFDSGLTTLKLNIPLFVLSPSLFQTPPKGNLELIKKGGLEFRTLQELAVLTKPKEIIFQEMTTPQKKSMRKKNAKKASQVDMFNDDKKE